MENKFKVGDRVEMISDNSRVDKGDTGLVVEYNSECNVEVLWDNFNGKGGANVEKQWSVDANKLMLLPSYINLKSTIGKALKNYGTTKAYRNEVMTHLENATFYQDEKLTFLKTDKGTGYALRNPEDANDTEKGIYLAVTRIFGKTKPKWQIEIDECVKKRESIEIKIKSESMQKEVETHYLSLGGCYYCPSSKNKTQVGKFLSLDHDLDILLNENPHKENTCISV